MSAQPRTTGLRSPWIPSILSGHHRATAAPLSLSRSDPTGRNPACPPNGPLTMKLSFHRYEDYGTLRFEGPRAEK